MMQEQWKRWIPTEGLPEIRYQVESIAFNDDVRIKESITIVLRDPADTNTIKLRFQSPMESYRCSEQKFRLETFNYLNATYGEDFYKNWSFFEVTNSLYSKWLSEESGTLSDHWGGGHIYFSLIVKDYFIDIVTYDYPKVEILK